MQTEPFVIKFMKWRKIWAALIGAMLVASVASLAVRGLEFGLDFTGGAQVELGFDGPADLQTVRQVLDEEGLESPVAVLFGSDSEVLIRTQSALRDGALEQINEGLRRIGSEATLEETRNAPSNQARFAEILVFSGVDAGALRSIDLLPSSLYGETQYGREDDLVTVSVENSLDNAYSQSLISALEDATGASIELRRSEFVGPQVGDDLRDQGGLGMLAALVVVMLYVAVRFQYKFGVGAVLSLVHDVILVLGVFSFWRLDFDLTVLAAVLAVIGYSLNDTIVIFDRIRENFRFMRRSTTEEIIDVSLTQTLERTLITSLTTLMVLVVLYFVGGELIRGFAFALIIGIVVGTFSSIYVATSMLLTFDLTKEDLMPPQKEGEEQESQAP